VWTTLKTKGLIRGALASLALAMWAAAPVAAQNPPAPATPQATPAPAAKPAKPPKPKLDKYKGKVLSFNLAQMIVQSTENEKMVWTFQYSAPLRQYVTDLLNSGGYQYGDRVQVYCNPGTTVAVKIKGKPSKS